jgi:hypothetical protein
MAVTATDPRQLLHLLTSKLVPVFRRNWVLKLYEVDRDR